MEELSEENHEEVDQSNAGELNDVEPYDPNDIWVLDVNSKNKVKSIKKLILEKIKLSKKANILVYKKNQTSTSLVEDGNMWIPLTEQDND